MKIKIMKLNEEAKVPAYACQGDAGMDLFSNEDVLILPGKRVLISTGICVEFSEEFVALIWDKSGIALKKGLTKIAGVIDSSYRGEWKIALFNLGNEKVQINKGDKIAQVLFQRIEKAQVEIVKSLSETSRGEGGFGSTGDK